MAELDLRQREGELVPITEVETLWFTLGRRIRDAMEGIPARILERGLAEVGEAGRQQQASIRLILEGEIKQALEQLSKSMTDATRAN
jgi:phage terminase Nu1 subunit (DNA packaging protein)